jgi:hypothetical protein
MSDEAALEKIRASLDEVTAAADKVAGVIAPT